MEETDNREKLLKGAEDLFMRYGVRSVSMDDIARNLGVSKKTIYQHFADKDDVVASVAKAHMQRQREQFDKIAAESKNAVEELVRISFCLKENMRNINPSLLFDMQKYHQRAWSEWLAFKRNFIRENVMRSLKQGMKEGYFRPELDTEIIATMRLEQVQMAFDHGVFPRDQYSLPEVQAQMFDHFVHGVMTEKGKKLYHKYRENTKELIPR
ncbi:MAG TPA: TetR/AcrR family transcriptional regulator [Ohtaekwangia sp.]|nr:TetR/AcrR family transcriptional regulator [Ohtaekwangia sp.]